MKNMESLFAAVITFGILLAIAVIGLVKSNASATRLNGSGATTHDATGRQKDLSGMSVTR